MALRRTPVYADIGECLGAAHEAPFGVRSGMDAPTSRAAAVVANQRCTLHGGIAVVGLAQFAARPSNCAPVAGNRRSLYFLNSTYECNFSLMRTGGLA